MASSALGKSCYTLVTNIADIIEFYKISLASIRKLSYKGQAMTLEFASKMVHHVGHEAKQVSQSRAVGRSKILVWQLKVNL